MMYYKNYFTTGFMAEPTTTTADPLASMVQVKAEPLWNDLMPFGALLPPPPPMYSPDQLSLQAHKQVTSSIDDSADDEFLMKQEHDLGSIWNPANSPLPPPPHGAYHPMLMMKMMMMNMEHKAGLAPDAGASLGPIVAPGLFARLSELNQMAAAAAASIQAQPMPPEVVEPVDKLEKNEPKPKPKRVRKPRTQNPNGRSRTKAVSANRRLVPSTVMPSIDPNAPKPIGPNPIYRCHLCPYTGNSKLHFNAHMNTHFDHRCPHCDYTSRTEGRLKRHIRDFHSETPPETWSGNRVKDSDDPTAPDDGGLSGDEGSGPNPARNRKYRCKQCNYVAIQKHDYWEHTKQHIKTDKMLNCPKCNFVTEFKHHLVYHLRNHFGSKPFKCAKCNYSCVNKSMLNSHMKSHSNIYQYRCEDCTYATKYCHSLKLHLRKYGHRPATVLNLDGTPNPYPVIDVYGTRRGPRPKKGVCLTGDEQDGDDEMQDDSFDCKPQNLSSSASSISSSSEPIASVTPPPSAPKPEPSSSSSPRVPPPVGANYLKCDYCPFQTESKQDFSNHLLEHVKHEKQTLVSKRKVAQKPKQTQATLAPLGSSTPPPTPQATVTSITKFDLPPLEPIQATHPYASFLPHYQSEFLFAPPQPTFACGELTPPTPTLEEPEPLTGQEISDTRFKPLDLSGKNPNQQSSNDDTTGMLPNGAAPNPMALLLMNSFLLNAQRNLNDVLEVSGEGEDRPEIPDNLPKSESSNRSMKRKGPANRIDLSRMMNSDEELDGEEAEEEMPAAESTQEEANYFELLKNSQMRESLRGDSDNGDDEEEEEDTEAESSTFQHRLPPTPTKSPNKGSSIFDFTEDSQSAEPTDLSPEPPTTASPPLAPAIVQLLAQLLQTNPTLNPGIIVQQLLPQLLLEGNCNLANVTAILSKVFSATSLMQEILMEMATIKK